MIEPDYISYLHQIDRLLSMLDELTLENLTLRQQQEFVIGEKVFLKSCPSVTGEITGIKAYYVKWDCDQKTLNHTPERIQSLNE